MAELRANLMGSFCTLETVRAVDEGDPGVSRTAVVNLITAPALRAQTSDIPNTAILWLIKSVGNRRRAFSMAGCPDGMIVNPPGPTSNPPWDGAASLWIVEMTKGYWAIKAVKRPPAAPEFAITAAAPGFPLTLTVPGLVVAPGDRIISRGNTPKEFNGNFLVTSISGDIITVNAEVFGVVLQIGGKARKVAFDLDPINSCYVEGENTHRRGRALKVSAGRRKR
jgi:hypothetical protein